VVASEFQHRLANLLERGLPKPIVEASRNALVYAAVKRSPGSWLLFSISNSLLLGVIASLALRQYLGVFNIMLMAVTALLFTVTFTAVFHNVLLYYGRRRSLQVEAMLPDALQLISANIRADMPIHKALLVAARPEFGLLASEIEQVGDDILSGKPTAMAFKDMSRRIQSPLLNRISTLMEEGLRTGHDLAGMLEQVAYDTRSFRILEDEARANIGSYVLFIFMAVLLVAPGLYAISISFVSLSDQVRSSLDVGGMISEAAVGNQAMLVNMVVGERGISADTLVVFSAINLAVSSAIAAVLVSILLTGESLQKMPYIPGFIIISEAVFFLALYVLSSVLTGVFAIAP